MGALHEGHLSLVRKGRRLAGRNGTLVVSLFVNPTQFGPAEDYRRYPRPVATDLRRCRENGVDVVFRPSTEDMYAEDHSVWVEESRLSTGLCGASRPGHFRGVCTVVLKLFQIIRPQIAVFGEKDYQQLAIIRRMVRDLNLPVRIASVKTVREPDGLALSSRNDYLTPEQRVEAPRLRKGLLEAAEALRSGRIRSAERLRRIVERSVSGSSEARIDYVEVVDAETLEPLKQADHNVLIAGAVYFGRTRLIDNIRIP